MEAKIVQDILQLHQEVVQKIQKQIESLPEGRPLSPELVLEEKESLLVHLKERLAAVREAKGVAIHRLSNELQNYEHNISSLEESIKKDREVLAGATSGSKKPEKPDERAVRRRKRP